VLNAEIGVNFDIHAGVERPNPLLPIPDTDIDLENLYERYLNFLKAQEILKAVRNVWKYTPLQNPLFVLACCIAAFGLCSLTKRPRALK